MLRKGEKKPYRIIGAYDSETSNVDDKGDIFAYPILHQLGIIDCAVDELCANNVEEHTKIYMYRHTRELYEKLDEIVMCDYDYVPVICCHNLAFDMYGLSPWLDSWCERGNVKVLAKSSRKPITFTICNETSPRLVIWDTLVFSQQPLERMGIDCGYPKAKGLWDYDLVRTPDTPLTENEIIYAQHDVYALLAWLGWWLKRNPDIEPGKLGLNVVTKTGVVRNRRIVRFDNMRGTCCKYNIGRYWHFINRTEAPKTDDELYTMFGATRGGFTFCASNAASVPYVLAGSNRRVIGYDATSQHPAQMVSHRYPVHFHETSLKALNQAFDIVSFTPLNDVLDNWENPFHVAFYACFKFTNLRPKRNSLFARDGVLPLASARFLNLDYELDEDNEQGQQFTRHLKNEKYCDTGKNLSFAFGKLVSADECELYITELTAWEIAQCYEWDNVSAVHGYLSTRFIRPTDMATVSVCQFYRAKNLFKDAREMYFAQGSITALCADHLREVNIADAIITSMANGTLSDAEVDSAYLALKADLNALFGIEASNEYRRDTVLGIDGIQFEGEQGIANKPKNPKAWYQFGQRIVGWSRISQICVMQLASPYIDKVINGDTDSVKFLMKIENMPQLEKALDRHAQAIDNAKKYVMKRIKGNYAQCYDPLNGIGHYVREFETEYFCAAWNKAYCMYNVDPRDGKRHYAFTLAGIPARNGANEFADSLAAQGMGYEDICNILLGYNVTYTYKVTGLNARKFPAWNSNIVRRIKDYRGNTSMVMEPNALALYPMGKTINDTVHSENMNNLLLAIKNNPNVNHDELLLTWDKGNATVINFD